MTAQDYQPMGLTSIITTWTEFLVGTAGSQLVTVFVCFLDGVGSALVSSVLTLLPEPRISAAMATNCPFSKLG